MLKIFSLSFFFLFSLFLSASAQPSPNISIGPEFGLPSGNFTNISGIGLGASVKADFPIAPEVSLTLDAGFMNFFGKKNKLINIQDLTYMPIKAGIKYHLSEGIYAEAQLGAAFPLNTGQARLFAWSPGLGNLFKLRSENLLDVSLRYEGWTGENPTPSFLNTSNTKGFVAIRFAYVFSL
ncbi:MAG: hypothetical protein EOP00_35015 [Pedobacter sp.]|nr:MAG: hypothetical protein EOP00_35015 [Pedobacter sp.]